MKKFFIGFIVLVLLLAGGAYALTRFISIDSLQQQVVESVKKQTGRDIAFDRPQLTFLFPNLALRLHNVTFSNVEGAHDKNMLTLEEMDLHLALQPLFRRQIEVAKFILKKPVIHLEVLADGKSSLDFGKAKEKEKTAGDNSGGGKGGVSDAASGFGFKFGQMQITDGKVTYRDAKKDTTETVDGINANLTYPDFSSPLQMDGELNYKGKRVNVVLILDKPIDFADGKPSGGDFRVNGDGMHFEVKKGKFATSGTVLSGKVDAAVDALSDFAGWLGGGKPQLPFKKLAFNSDTTISSSSFKLSGAKLTLDDIEAGGDVTATLQGHPAVKAQLKVNHINLDSFTKASKDAAAEKGAKKAAPAPQEDWDATPMDFNGLKAVDADLSLETGGFTMKGADVGASTLTVALKDGSLHFKSSEAALFGGKFSSDLTVSAAGSLAVKFDMSGVQAKPMLTAFADFKKLDGTAFATASVTSSGHSQKEIVGNLQGGGTFDFKNGSLQGIDLVDIAKLIQSRLAEMDVGKGKTDFVDLAGTYTIKNGVAHNDDLKMKGPLVQTTGSGDVDLPHKMVAYRALPVLTASSGIDDAKGLTVPVDIKGPFSNIKVKPDYKAVLTGVLGNPEKVQKTVKQGQEILKDVKKDPNKAINDLLNSGLFGKKKKPAPDATADSSAPPPADGTAPPGNAPAAPPGNAPAAPQDNAPAAPPADAPATP